MPILHTSHLFEKSWFARISGAVQSGVPKRVSFCVLLGSSTTRLNPKSLSLATPCLSSMFAGLMSRWMMCVLRRVEQPCMRWRMKVSASASESPSFFLLRQFLRSPSSQYSSTIQMWSPERKQSYSLTMKGEDSVVRFLISFSTCFSTDLVIFLISMLFTATFIPSLFCPKKTDPVAPTPSGLDFRMRQFPISSIT